METIAVLKCLLSAVLGKILTDDFADKEGLEMGDEYFANLDHIESVENFKEGYESEAHCSDSDGSGVDMSRIKLTAASKHGKPNTKEERNSSTTGKSERPEPVCVGKSKIAVIKYNFSFFTYSPGQDDSSEESSDDKEEDSNDDDSDSSDDTFVKDTYYTSSSVWRSYTTRRQAKGMKEGQER